ncbi:MULTISPECIES: hypothetical protein [unclassified Thiocapsa]|uniref:hypothetical protein n=1 Tax=unclassified Thiocapsa TaxID=2641286 RepID=UPI0035AD7868
MLGVVALIDADLVVATLIQAWTLMLKLAPLFILVLLMVALSETFLDARSIGRWVGYSSGPRGWLIALAAGTLSVGPMHVWVAILQDLRAKGMREGLIAAFFFSRTIQIFFLPLIIGYFGWAFTLILAIQVMIFAVINGLLIDYLLARGDGRAPQDPRI